MRHLRGFALTSLVLLAAAAPPATASPPPQRLELTVADSVSVKQNVAPVPSLEVVVMFSKASQIRANETAWRTAQVRLQDSTVTHSISQAVRSSDLSPSSFARAIVDAMPADMVPHAARYFRVKPDQYRRLLATIAERPAEPNYAERSSSSG
jgi:hypothetical protein